MGRLVHRGARRRGAEDAAPTAALWRYVIATSALLALSFAIERGLPRLSRAQWLGVCLLGVTGVVLYNVFFMFGMQTVSASRGSLIIATVPAATLLGGALFLHEPLTLRRVPGIADRAARRRGRARARQSAGAASRATPGIGEAALFGGVLAWAAYTLLGKRLLAELSPLAATTYAALIGTAMLALLCAVDRRPRAARGDLQRGWMRAGVPGTLRHRARLHLVLRRRASRSARRARSVFVNLVPIAAITFAVLLLGEPLELSMVVGAALVVSRASSSSTGRTARNPRRPSPPSA